MSRPNLMLLRDAALGYASRGIPVLTLHYPLPHRADLQALTSDQRLLSPAVRTSCSCRDPGCGQPAKHPLGSLVPHGVKDATTNRARVLAWWTRHPRPTSAWPPATCSTSWTSTAPPAPTPSEPWQRARPGELGAAGSDWRWRLAFLSGPDRPGQRPPARLGACGLAGPGRLCGRPTQPPLLPVGCRPGSRHPPGQVPSVLLERLQPRQLQRPTGPVQLPSAADGLGERYAQAALAEELARVAAAPVGQRNRQLWESTRNLYNLVATGALDQREVHQGLLAAADRCGLLSEEPRQTHRTLASGRQVGLAHPGRPAYPTSPERTHAPSAPPARAAGERTQERR
jgi:hypothetical protein